MLKKLFLICCIITAYGKIYAQETMSYPDGKQYKATPTWDFICENYALTGVLKAQIAKTDKGGILKLAVEVTDEQFYIGGTVYLFLSDFSAITCTDKGIRATSGKEVIAFYTLSVSEMNRLKSKTITDIRFVIKGKETAFSSKIGNFTAVNKKKYFEGYDRSVRNSFETETQISALYQ